MVTLDKIKQNLPKYIEDNAVLNSFLGCIADALETCHTTINGIKTSNTDSGATGSELDTIAVEHYLKRYMDTDDILRIRLYNSIRDAQERGSRIGVERDGGNMAHITPLIHTIQHAIGINPIGTGYAIGGSGKLWMHLWDGIFDTHLDIGKEVKNYLPLHTEIGINKINYNTQNITYSGQNLYEIPTYVSFTLIKDITYNHNLGAKPLTALVGVSNKVINGDITHTDDNNIRIQFANNKSVNLHLLKSDGTQAFASTQSVVVSHTAVAHPLVQILDSNGKVTNGDVKHDSNSQFTVTFVNNKTGTILWAKTTNSVSFTSQSEITQYHYFGFMPFVQVEDTTGKVMRGDIIHDNSSSPNYFTVKFVNAKSGKIYYSNQIVSFSDIVMTNFEIIPGGIKPINTSAEYQSKVFDLSSNYADYVWYADWNRYARWDVKATELLSIRFSDDHNTWTKWKYYEKNQLINPSDLKQNVQFKYELTLSNAKEMDFFIVRNFTMKWLDTTQFLYGQYPLGIDIPANIIDSTIS